MGNFPFPADDLSLDMEITAALSEKSDSKPFWMGRRKQLWKLSSDVYTADMLHSQH